MHDHSKRKALGSARLKVEHEGNKHERNFVIVDQEVSPLLGLKSLQGMGLVKIIVPGVDNPVNNVVTAPEIESAFSQNVTNDAELSPFADVFQGIGCFPGEYTTFSSTRMFNLWFLIPNEECLFPRRKQ